MRSTLPSSFPSSCHNSTSNSTSSSSSYLGQDPSKAGMAPQRTKISENTLPFDGAQRKEMVEAVRRCGRVACQILTPSEKQSGTGCLVGTVLLLTTHRVLPNKETARNSSACFFRLVCRSRRSNQKGYPIETVKIPLDPDSFFFTSKGRVLGKEPQLANKNPLHFTVVALKPDPYLFANRKLALPLFDPIPPKPGTPICVIQAPEVVKSGDVLETNLRWFFGQIKEVTDNSIAYDTRTSPDSSGGAVIDSQGRLIALHHRNRPDGLNVGFSTQKIAAFLAEQKVSIRRSDATPLPPSLIPKRIISLPESTVLFSGRKEELKLLRQICKQEGNRIAVLGLDGVGKTALVVKYTNDHQDDYSLICFIQSETEYQINTGLLNLANVLNIKRASSAKRRLKFLKSYFETSQARVLLIFDGVDDRETLTYLYNLLPSRGCTILLISSLLQDAFPDHFRQLSLKSFTKDDAVAFLLKAVGKKDTDAVQAALLAEKLNFLPLALVHAAAYIRHTPGYTLKKYQEPREEYGLQPFDPKYNSNERTVLTTWKKSLEAIRSIHQCQLAETILQFASIFEDSPLQLNLLRKPFLNDELEFYETVKHLIDYSLIEVRGNSYVLHSLLQRMIRHELGEVYKPPLLQGIATWCEISKNILEIRKQTMGKDHPSNAEGHHDLGILLRRLGRNEEALAHLRRALKIRIKKFGDRHLTTAESYQEVGITLSYLGRNEEALTHLKSALKIRIQKWGRNHPATADSHQEVGFTLGELGSHEEALHHQLKALKIRRQRFGDHHLVTAESYGNVGVALSYLGKHKEAFRCDQYALKIRRRELGEHHPKTADTLREIGVTLSYLGMHEEALTHQELALKIRIQKLGSDHPDTADSYRHVGITLSDLRRDEEALPRQKLALEIRKQKFGDDHPITADSYLQVGINLSNLGEHKKALIHLEEALRIHKQKLGDDHPTTAESFLEVGITLDDLGKHQEALQHKQLALEIYQKKFGDDHPKTANIYQEIGITLKKLASMKNQQRDCVFAQQEV